MAYDLPLTAHTEPRVYPELDEGRDKSGKIFIY